MFNSVLSFFQNAESCPVYTECTSTEYIQPCPKGHLSRQDHLMLETLSFQGEFLIGFKLLTKKRLSIKIARLWTGWSG